MKLKKDNMAKPLSVEMLATEIANYLVRKGVSKNLFLSLGIFLN